MTLPNKFKPMLADNVELNEIKFPVYASPKLDGVRCVVFGGVAYSRSLKHIPNRHVQTWAKTNEILLEGLDGELCVGSLTEPGLLRRTTSVVMSHDKPDAFSFQVFGLVNDEPFVDRLNKLNRMANWQGEEFETANIQFVKQTLIIDENELFEYERVQLSLGYEGTMVASPGGKYKFGRASVKSAELLKRKPFVDAEFLIVGYEPMYHNDNEAKTNELGRTARSTSKSGLVELDTLGSFVCQVSAMDTRTFNVGTGYDMDTRAKLWKIRDKLVGKSFAKVKYFEQGKVGGIPELPVFLDIRYPEDM
jgi:DNA ligase 1